jgi:hypothetical protein
MINISEIDEYWWVIMREDNPGMDKKTQILPQLFKNQAISGIISRAGGGL